MATKKLVGELTDEEILRIARIRVTESSNSTFTQGELDTQLSVERGVIWLIHFIEIDFEQMLYFNEVAAAGSESIQVQATRESKTGTIFSNDADMIQKCTRTLTRSAAIGTDAGPLWYQSDSIVRYDYPIPMPYASQSLFVGILGTDAAAAWTVSVRVGYSIRTVSDKFFFRVAQALLG